MKREFPLWLLCSYIHTTSWTCCAHLFCCSGKSHHCLLHSSQQLLPSFEAPVQFLLHPSHCLTPADDVTDLVQCKRLKYVRKVKLEHSAVYTHTMIHTHVIHVEHTYARMHVHTYRHRVTVGNNEDMSVRTVPPWAALTCASTYVHESNMI